MYLRAFEKNWTNRVRVGVENARWCQSTFVICSPVRSSFVCLRMPRPLFSAKATRMTMVRSSNKTLTSLLTRSTGIWPCWEVIVRILHILKTSYRYVHTMNIPRNEMKWSFVNRECINRQSVSISTMKIKSINLWRRMTGAWSKKKPQQWTVFRSQGQVRLILQVIDIAMNKEPARRYCCITLLALTSVLHRH